MDADAELAALRRRAYGPAADIADDPAALARLRELEGALASRPQQPASQPAPRDQGRESDEGRALSGSETLRSSHPLPPQQAAALVVPPADVRAARARPAWHTAMVLAVAGVTLLIGATAVARTYPRPDAAASATPTDTDQRSPAFAFAGDPTSRILVHIPLDGSPQDQLDLPDPSAGPRFPTNQTLIWSRSLGEYYGWQLWVARDEEGRACMLATGVGGATSRCDSPQAQAQGALFLSVPYSAVTDGERPAGMTPDQSLGFWWIPEGTVLVLTGRTADVEP